MKHFISKIWQHVKISSHHILLFFVFLFLLLFIFRSTEFILMESLDNLDYLGYGYYLDFLTALSFTFYLSFIFLLFKNSSKLVSYFVFWTISLISISLSVYFNITGKLLGQELFHYTYSEKYKIISSGLSNKAILISLFYLSVSIILFYLYKKNNEKSDLVVTQVLGLLFLLTIPFVWNNNKKHLFNHSPVKKFMNLKSYYCLNSKIPFLNMALISEFSTDKDFTYNEKELKQAISSFQNENPSCTNSDFPYLSDVPKNSSLSKFFVVDKDKKPNIVIIISESWSTSFSGESSTFGSYTPFVDSLSKHSLYWPNTLSNAEKSYGALPNILGSLPYGRRNNSFTYEENLVGLEYSTLYSILPPEYFTSFSHGGGLNFDNSGPFLIAKGIDGVLGENELEKITKHKKNLTWGFDDYQLFHHIIPELQANREPFSSTIFTLGMHHPFDQKPINELSHIVSGEIKNHSIKNAILSSDDAIKQYFNEVENEDFHQNTIYIIVGDHCIDKLSLRSPIDAFHVPTLIYSPLLKTPRMFKNPVVHKDILPTLIGLLSSNFSFKSNKPFVSLGKQLDTNQIFRPDLDNSLSLRYDNLPQYIKGKHYLVQNQVWEITDSLLNSKPIKNDSIMEILVKKVRERRVLNEYTVTKNKLLPKVKTE